MTLVAGQDADVVAVGEILDADRALLAVVDERRIDADFALLRRRVGRQRRGRRHRLRTSAHAELGQRVIRLPSVVQLFDAAGELDVVELVRRLAMLERRSARRGRGGGTGAELDNRYRVQDRARQPAGPRLVADVFGLAALAALHQPPRPVTLRVADRSNRARQDDKEEE